jgi:hypothetical protein
MAQCYARAKDVGISGEQTCSRAADALERLVCNVLDSDACVMQYCYISLSKAVKWVDCDAG